MGAIMGVNMSWLTVLSTLIGLLLAVVILGSFYLGDKTNQKISNWIIRSISAVLLICSILTLVFNFKS